MKSLITILAVLVISIAANAQNTNSSPPFKETTLANFTPTKAEFGSRIDLRVGYGVNLTSHDTMAAAALSCSLSPSVAFGVVVAHDSTGWQMGGCTLGINGSVNVPVIGRLDMFAGDGVAYDARYHSAANYLFIGCERPFFIGKFRIAPGFSLANTSTRAGTVLLVGTSVRF